MFVHKWRILSTATQTGVDLKTNKKISSVDRRARKKKMKLNIQKNKTKDKIAIKDTRSRYV